MPPASWEFPAIGTSWQIVTAADLDAAVRADVTRLIDGFDRSWSRFRDDSLVNDLARAGGVRAAPPDTSVMLDAYLALSAATDGAVNPLIGTALSQRGYDAGYRLIDEGAVAAPADWTGLLRWSAHEIELRTPTIIDVGALGKGRLVDLVAALVRSRTEGPVIVDGGGDIAVSGVTERIALEHPYDARRAIGVWEVTDAALCASAINRRAWGGGLHHVLDARTGEPVRTIAATWAVAPDAMTADAIATALFFEGGAAYAAARDAQWVRMTTDGRVEWSPACEAELFS